MSARPVNDHDWFGGMAEARRRHAASYDAEHGEGAWAAHQAAVDAKRKAEDALEARRERGYALGAAWRSLPPVRRSEAGLAFTTPSELAVLSEPLESTRNMIIMGGTGAGKTTLASVYMARALQAAEETGEQLEIARRMRFIFVSDLVRARAEARFGTGEAELIADAKQASVLILDDLGTEPEDRDKIVAEVVTMREAYGRRVIVTTWLTEAQIAARYGANVHRRVLMGARVSLPARRRLRLTRGHRTSPRRAPRHPVAAGVAPHGAKSRHGRFPADSRTGSRTMSFSCPRPGPSRSRYRHPSDRTGGPARDGVGDDHAKKTRIRRNCRWRDRQSRHCSRVRTPWAKGPIYGQSAYRTGDVDTKGCPYRRLVVDK